MTAVQLIDHLTRLGVELWADDGQLRFRAPASVLTDAHKSALRANKTEILALLNKKKPEEIEHDPTTRYEPFPLTDVQTAYLLGRKDSLDYGSVACHGYLEIMWPALTASALEEAWNCLVKRHDMLRAVIEQDGYQRVLPDVPRIQIESVDLNDATPETVQHHLDAIRDDMDHRIYDTATWPLFALRHTRTPDGDIVHFSFDALIADWASAGILFDELDIILANRASELAPLEIGFRDYLLAERQRRDTARYHEDRRYWIDRIETLPVAPQLPLRQGGPESGPARFRRHSLHLPSDRWARFRAHAVAYNVTPTALLLTTYANVIRRWSRQSAFSLNLTLLNRMPIHPQVEKLVGDFTSVCILEIKAIEGNFVSQARTIGEQIFADLDHRLFSGVETIREIARRHGRAAALMPVVFTGTIGTHSIDPPASGRQPGYGITQTPQVLLDCQAGDGPDGLRVHWDVRQNVFPDGMIEDMFTVFTETVERLADDADAGFNTLDLGLPTWQRQERDAVNATATPYERRLLYADILTQAERLADKVAVADIHGNITYRELVMRANGLAYALRDHGLTSGEHVAVAVGKSCEQIIAVLGVLIAGGAYVPIDVTQPRLRRERIIEQAHIRFAVGNTVGELDEWPVTLTLLSTHGVTASSVPPEPIATPDSLAYVIFTSGSTGEPKGVMISHGAALNTIDDMSNRFDIREQDRVLGLAQLGFDLSVYDIFGVLGQGGTLVFPDPARVTDPSHWVERLATESITLWNSVPAQMQMLVDYLDSKPHPLPSLGQAWLSGDWIPINLPVQVHRHMPGLRLVSLGGATEASIWSNYYRVDTIDPKWTSIPYGVPLANQSFCVLDHNMRDVPVWVPGDLYIGGMGLAQGYLDNPALTEERFVFHPVSGERLYRTGDLARYLPGGMVEFLGREDGQVKLRGYRIELGEIESALTSHPNVSAAAAVISEGDGDERSLLCFVETARRSIDTSAETVPNLTAIRRHADKSGFSLSHADYVSDLHNAAYITMLHTLRCRGAWHEGSASIDAILDDAKIDARHRWLVRHWVKGLHTAGWLERDNDGLYYPAERSDTTSVFDAWERVSSGASEAHMPISVVDYLRVHANRLDDLLDDRCNPFELLFPQGGDHLALALYGEEPASRHNNQTLAALLHQIASRRDDNSPLRILEIGAGTGATTAVVAPMLDGLEIDYFFTDQSTFFLPEARRRHAAYPWIRHGLLDIDRDPREQGVAPSSFDVVVCAGVLGSVRDPVASLRRIGEMLAPDGWLLFTEPTLDHPHILLSQGFMMSPTDGDRDRGLSPFLSVSRWNDAIQASGGETVLCLPQDDHPLANGHMRFFAARYKRDRTPLSSTTLQRYLAERLPAYMLPSQLQVVDHLPLTANGKLDRKLLTTWRIRQVTSDFVDPTVENDPLTGQLCALWADALGVSTLGRDDNFYEHGADSLILARVAGRVRDEVPGADAHAFDTVLRHMLNEPTVAALARLLRGDGRVTDTNVTIANANTGIRAGSNALLVPFGGGEGVTRVMFHAALGTLDYFQHLGTALAAQQQGPVLGVAVANTEHYLGIDAHKLIDTVADDYAQRLIDEGHTRFQLVGYCLGGLLATEVARRLLKRGLDVVDLSLVDSIPMFIDTDEELAFEAIFVPNLNLDPVKAVFGPEVNDVDVYRAIDRLMTDNNRKVPAGSMAALKGDAGLESVAKAAKQRAALSQDERLAGYASAAALQAGLPVSPELVPALFRVCRHSMRAARFDPLPFVGDMTFLRCQEQQSFGVTGGVGHLAAPFWEDTCLGEFRLIDVPGNHFSVIEPPHVSVVTSHLLDALRRRA